MINFKRRMIFGRWSEGFSLDIHTISSTLIGYNEFGHEQFDTQRSEIGELLYKLKNKSDQCSVPEIVEAVARLMEEWDPAVDIIVPVPPSNPRAVQPVLVLAKAISQRLEIPLANCVTRTRNVPQLKNIFDLDARAQILENLHTVDKSVTRDKSVLLFDDLYRSGATMNAVANALYSTGEVAKVFALTITRTRRHQ